MGREFSYKVELEMQADLDHIKRLDVNTFSLLDKYVLDAESGIQIKMLYQNLKKHIRDKETMRKTTQAPDYFTPEAKKSDFLDNLVLKFLEKYCDDLIK